MQYDEFVHSVAALSGIRNEEAERASLAVLQELADRLTGKEARDLLAQLPRRLQQRVIVSPRPLPIPADDFVEHVARALEVPPDEARRRIRGVFATLRRAVSWGELEDVLGPLDPEYADLLA
jgi:uncharacterized protein (DUF2267 family)